MSHLTQSDPLPVSPRYVPLALAALAAVIMSWAAVRALAGPSADIDEFKVKRQEVFEFTEKPTVKREAAPAAPGEKTTISFASKAFCDATVAIEETSGQPGQPGQPPALPARIVRHLACGVLGPNAPEPFQKNSLAQRIVWDGKDDAGVYVEHRDHLAVRVSLGLKPRFERTMFWSPHKRIGLYYPVVRAAAEGVYVAEGYAVDHVRLFDHQGNYIRTVYPFPADAVDKVVGLKTHTFVQDGKTLPLKDGYHQATLLTCGNNATVRSDAPEGYAVSAMAAVGEKPGKLALVHLKLNRLASDGTTGGDGKKLAGPRTSIAIARDACGWGHPEATLAPLSAALSPDGKWLYLAGYQCEWGNGWGGREWMNGVWRLAYGEEAEPTLFVGDAKPGVKAGSADEGKCRMVTSVACDTKGRVYVSDYWNDRIGVFDDAGKHLKSIPVNKPAYVAVHQKTGDIYAFSWMLNNRMVTSDQFKIPATMTHFGPLENPAVKATCPLPMPGGYNPTVSWNVPGGVQFRVELDSWADTPTVWLVNGKVAEMMGHDDGSIEGIKVSFDGGCVQMFEEVDGKLIPKRSFADDVKKSVRRLIPPILWRQRLYVNPANGKVYVAEGDCGVMKAFNQLVELDPATGKTRLVDLPMGAEDMCFDVAGQLYLRTDTIVARYDPVSWREIPWDYGEERENHSYGMGAKGANLVSGLSTPGHRSFNFWHLGGMAVSPRGDLLVTTCNGAGMNDDPQWRRGEAHFNYKGRPYTPPIYPGRMRWGEIHIFDKHGKALQQDVVPGVAHMNGIGMDRDYNIYMMLASRRLIGGKPFDPDLPHDMSGTLVKVPAGKAKVLSAGGGGHIPVALTEDAKPKRPIDVSGYNTGWIEGANWLYGGVGYCTPPLCVCWNSRFELDLFARSFAPEPLHFTVAVLDSSGNLILRVGRYGNVDDGMPLVTDGGPAKPHSVGGDEVALAHACYVAAHTDHRLFIADAGNARILSVRLDYHAAEKVPLN